MEAMGTKEIVELIAAGIMAGGIGGIIYARTRQKKSFGKRVIQMSAVVLLIPVILIMGLEQVLKGETIGTLIGGLIGYLLSGINEDRRNSPQDPAG